MRDQMTSQSRLALP